MEDIGHNTVNMSYMQSLYSYELATFAIKVYQALPKDTTHLVSGGSSGCAIASGVVVIAALKGKALDHVTYYTKAAESHRGIPTNNKRAGRHVGFHRGVFVDDFIDEGKTMFSVLSKMEAEYRDKITHAVVASDIYLRNYGSEKKEKLERELKIEIVFATNGYEIPRIKNLRNV